MLNAIFGKCVKTATKTPVATKLVREGEGLFKGYMNSPEVDKFIKQGTSEVIGDNIVRINGSLPYRVVTKKLPTKTVVSKAFRAAGDEAYTEIIKGDGSVAYNNRLSNCTVVMPKWCLNTYKPCTYGKVEHIQAPIDVSRTLASDAVGLTEKANANNSLYNKLKEVGSIPVNPYV